MFNLIDKRGLVALVAAANGEVPEERGVDLEPVFEVARRAVIATADLPKEYQNIAVQLAVKEFLQLATKGSATELANRDLLPIGHPLSVASTEGISKETVLASRANWLSADSNLTDSTKEMVRHAATLSDEISGRHAQARLRVLVASGELPAEFASVIEKEESDMENLEDLSEYVKNYYASRDAFIDTLNQQVSLSTGTNLYDLDGKITRMALRGDSREKIRAALMKNSIFKANTRLVDAEPEDVFEAATKIRFEEFLVSLEEVIDLKSDPDYRETAIDLISKYDENGQIAELINSGTDSYSILKALDEVPAWAADLRNYITRGDVEISRPEQEDGWLGFAEVVDAIKDLDDYEDAQDSLTAALTLDK
jgi:hypothetical protein